MSVECLCGQNVGNLGSPTCAPTVGKILRANFRNRFQNDGTENFIDTTATLNAAFFNALQYHTDTTIRIYPLAIDLEEVTSPKEETRKKVYKSGRIVKLDQGARSTGATIPLASAPLVDKINGRGCTKDTVLFFTTKGILGWRKVAGKLHGIPIAPDSMDAVLQLQDEDDPQRLMLMFQWAKEVSDGQLAIIPWTSIEGIDLMAEFLGKQDANIEQVAGNRSTTTFRVKITLDYGDAVNMLPVEDLVTADFTVYNVTDSSSETLTSATEVSGQPGVYDFVLSGAETATDILRLGLASTDNAKPFDATTWYDVQIALQ